MAICFFLRSSIRHLLPNQCIMNLSSKHIFSNLSGQTKYLYYNTELYLQANRDKQKLNLMNHHSDCMEDI